MVGSTGIDFPSRALHVLKPFTPLILNAWITIRVISNPFH